MSNQEIEFGMFLPTMGEYSSVGMLRTLVERAREHGFTYLWAGDHLTIPRTMTWSHPYRPQRPSFYDPSGRILNVFEVLGFLGGLTESLRLGTNICVVPYRSPIPLAKSAVTLSDLLEGRFEFGVGVGWLEAEFEALGVPFDQRGRRTDEFLQLFVKVCEEGEFAFDGPHHQFPYTGFRPCPTGETRPDIWVGGRSEATYRRLARYGDGWTTAYDSPRQVKSCVETIRSAWRKAERSGQPRIAVHQRVRIGPGEGSDRNPLEGSLEEVVEGVRSYAEAGVDRLAMELLTPSNYRDEQELLDQVDRFGTEVMSRF